MLQLERSEIESRLNARPQLPPKETLDRTMLNRIQSAYDILLSPDYTIAQKSDALKGVVEKIIFYKSAIHIDVFYYYTPGRP